MDLGYVKLWRKSIDSGLMCNAELWMFWCWCLMKASHRAHKQMIGYQMIELMPGEFIFGRRQAAKELPLSEQTIRTCLKKLKNLENLTLKTTHHFTVISITNWDKYQQTEELDNPQNNPQVTHGQPTANHKQECKNVKKRKYILSGNSNSIPYAEILQHLNQTARKNFKHTIASTQSHIHARWEQGFRLEDFIRVIDSKVAQWLNDPKMSKYLRPETLFGTKFEGYLNESPKSSTPTSQWEEYEPLIED